MRASSPPIRLAFLLLAPAIACGNSDSARDNTASTAGILSVGDTSNTGTVSAESTAEPSGTDPTSTTGSGTNDNDDDGPVFDIGGSSASPDVAIEVDCDPLVATIRDFSSDHPDFETYSGQGAHNGLVKPLIGADFTPELDPTVIRRAG